MIWCKKRCWRSGSGSVIYRGSNAGWKIRSTSGRVAGAAKGYRYTEIAAQLGVSVGTVQGYLGRIRALGRAFFGVDGNKRVLDVVNKSGTSARDIPDSNQVEEVSNDETMEDADGSSRFSDDTESAEE